jgi:hypothetical protein
MRASTTSRSSSSTRHYAAFCALVLLAPAARASGGSTVVAEGGLTWRAARDAPFRRDRTASSLRRSRRTLCRIANDQPQDAARESAARVPIASEEPASLYNMEPRVSAIVVLGMHRSGTSSVAGALVRLGGGAPAHLMDPAPCNERGFWESPLIMALNDEILEAAGSHWGDCHRFDHQRIAEPAASELRARAAATLISEFGEAAHPVVKDPRMCRLLDFWKPVFKDLG